MAPPNDLSVPGFKAGGKRGEKYGVAVVVSDEMASCSVMVTSNKIKAAPVEISMGHAKDNIAQGIVITSGNANAFTGVQGMKDANKICELGSTALGIKKSDIIVNSTGIIGQHLEMKEIEELIIGVTGELMTNESGIFKAASAMKTTDSFEKIATRKIVLDDREIRITGFAKGAGMIAPDLLHATMIAVILTDAPIPNGSIDRVLKEAVSNSFNMINVDGDTSTNDMVIFLAKDRDAQTEVDPRVQAGVNDVCLDLAKLIVRDGEGATKFFEMEVKGARTVEDARQAAKTVVRSILVKTAVFGENPNWGRIIAAIGYSGVEFDPSALTLKLKSESDEVVLVEDGQGIALKETNEIKRAEDILKSKEVTFTVDLGVGDFSATAFGCDLGYNYVKVNAVYTN
jgi:glutamate N-acetyltransferase/amino-acid N-acetyltransferase